MLIPQFLTFSDGAKFALVARNLFSGLGFTTDFSFWGPNLFATGGIPHLVPYAILVFMKIFGVNDFAVIAFSMTFYLLLGYMTFLLARRLFDRGVGIISAVAILSSLQYFDYATSGASEPMFAFEIVLGIYLFTFRKLPTDILGFLTIILMYFTRPQAFIFIAGMVLFYLLIRMKTKKALAVFLGLGVLGFLVDKYLIYPLSFRYPLTPVFVRGIQSIFTYSSFDAVSDGLRGAPSSTLSGLQVIKKVFYNIYNFYKSIGQIFNPYLFIFFVLSAFKSFKSKLQKDFVIFGFFSVVFTLIVTALTIPFYRYLHPVMPVIYIIGAATLVEVLKGLGLRDKKLGYVSAFVIIFVSLGVFLGKIILDSRFEKAMTNQGKPPIYALMSYKLKEETDKDGVIVTNLDTWGSWYGERKTVWFPLKPSMLISKEGEIPFEAIYLTSYKTEDENYFMGEDWHMIYDNPESPMKWTCEGCAKIRELYELKNIYEFARADNYENISGKAILLVRK